MLDAACARSLAVQLPCARVPMLCRHLTEHSMSAGSHAGRHALHGKFTAAALQRPDLYCSCSGLESCRPTCPDRAKKHGFRHMFMFSHMFTGSLLLQHCRELMCTAAVPRWSANGPTGCIPCAGCGSEQEWILHPAVLMVCKESGGSSIFEHQRRRKECKECGGSSICEHQHERNAGDPASAMRGLHHL